MNASFNCSRRFFTADREAIAQISRLIVIVSESQFTFRTRTAIIKICLPRRISPLRPENGVKVALALSARSVEIVLVFVSPVGLCPAGYQTDYPTHQNNGSNANPTCSRQSHLFCPLQVPGKYSQLLLFLNLTEFNATGPNPRRRLYDTHNPNVLFK
jgi:hypothetical protein